jgi:LacI family transcriptional regulator
MQEKSLPIREEYMCKGDLDPESAYRFGMELSRLASPPSAVIASNNKMLLDFMRAIRELHFRCPEQISVVGFDDHVWTEHFTPRLTVVAQPAYEIGKVGTETLLSKIRATQAGKPGNEDGLVLLRAELRIRESTAACAPPGEHAVIAIPPLMRTSRRRSAAGNVKIRVPQSR